MARKPHSGNAGYVCELKARLGGHIVVYDRESGADIDADHRWIVMHEPSSNHLAVKTERQARAMMKALANAATSDESLAIADGIFPGVSTPAVNDTPAAAGARAAALERFLADPENEPTPAGKAALREALGLTRPAAPKGENDD